MRAEPGGARAGELRGAGRGEGVTSGPTLQSEEPPPPMQRDPLKARDSPLPSAVKGALASAMPFRSSLKKHSFGRFFYGGVFFALFFHLLFSVLFLPLPPQLCTAPPLAGAWPCGPPCAAELQHGSMVLSCPTALIAPLQLNYSQISITSLLFSKRLTGRVMQWAAAPQLPQWHLQPHQALSPQPARWDMSSFMASSETAIAHSSP